MALYSFGLLCLATSLMVAVVSGISSFYSRPLASVAGAGSRGAGGNTFNRFYENAAARSMQVGSCAVSGAHEVCHTADLESDFQVHICPTDGSPCYQNVCYYTSVPPCCPDVLAFAELAECKSVTILLVEGKTFNVTHYRIPLADNQICVSISPAVEICDEACTLTEVCTRTDICTQNLECDSNGANCQCREGFLDSEERRCCDCEDGYYKNGTRCIKFCRENCRTRAGLDENGQPIGQCTTCFNGYEPPTCCNCSSDLVEVDNICKPKNLICDKNQTLYFYIDATQSIQYNDFCPLIIVMQMLVAAFNPSSTSGTKINALLFPDIPRSRDPSPVFNSSATCLEAIQGQNGSLLSLLSEFGACHDNSSDSFAYNSTLFPSLCGEGTSAVKGLQEILRLASTSTKSSAEGAIVMLTDGIIIDDASKRTEVLNNLKSAGINTLIAAGFNKANKTNLRLYTSSDNILVGDDPVQLGIDIVNKMQERGIVCQDHADNITRSLNESRGGDLINLFCRCHRNSTQPVCQRKLYPTCGGSLSFGLPNLPSGRARTEALEYMNRLLIEEEILAAVEKVLEQRHG